MIGASRVRSVLRTRRALLRGLAAVVIVGALMGLRSPNPMVADPASAAAARGMLVTARGDASDALDALVALLDRALSEGRTGAGLTVAGATPPGPHLSAAADALAGGDALAARARAALGLIAGQLAILEPGVGPPALAVGPGAVGSAAAQLRDTVDAANAFADLRHATQTTLRDLGTALAALGRSDPAGALAALDLADQSLAAVKAWPGQLDTLPIWIDTTGRLLSASRRIAVATRDDDAAALNAAGDDYQAAAADAHKADLALSIAFAEGGSGVTQAALQALADLRVAVADTRAQLDALPAASD